MTPAADATLTPVQWLATTALLFCALLVLPPTLSRAQLAALDPAQPEPG
jgi:hypothetical protein